MTEVGLDADLVQGWRPIERMWNEGRIGECEEACLIFRRRLDIDWIFDLQALCMLGRCAQTHQRAEIWLCEAIGIHWELYRRDEIRNNEKAKFMLENQRRQIDSIMALIMHKFVVPKAKEFDEKYQIPSPAESKGDGGSPGQVSGGVSNVPQTAVKDAQTGIAAGAEKDEAIPLRTKTPELTI